MARYAPLSTAQKEIRLIVLASGSWQNTISCRLVVFSLEKGFSSSLGPFPQPPVYEILPARSPHPQLPLPAFDHSSGPSSRFSRGLGYEALSYVWGDNIQKFSIEIAGNNFQVTQNLFSALKHLRLEDRDRVLWVDAICINQGDIDERNQQVQIMQTIYWSARRVIVWMGERTRPPILIPMKEGYPLRKDRDPRQHESLDHENGIYRRYLGLYGGSKPFTIGEYAIVDDTGGAFDLMKILSSLDEHIDTALWEGSDGLWKDKDTDPGDSTTARTVKDLFELSSESLYEILDRPWWTRTWTIQECVLSREVVVACGGSLIPWDLITQTSRYLQAHKTCCSDILQIKEDESPLEEFIKINRIRYNIQKASKFPILDGSCDLYFLMTAFRRRFATDQRDKVYGVLGLIDNDHARRLPPPQVDYSLSVAEVYALATVYIIKFEGDLRVFPGPYEPERLPQLPSWVIDWSYQDDPYRSFLLDVLYEDLYRGSRSNMRNAALYSDLVLALNGHKIDTITHIGEALMTLPKDHDKVPAEIYGWILLAYRQLVPTASQSVQDALDPRLWWDLESSIYNRNDNLMAAFCRTIVGDTIQRSRGTEDDVGAVKRWLNFNTAYALDQWRRRPRVFIHHRFFITASGLIGMAPPKTEVGDVLYILQGGGVPIALRPVGPPGPEDGNGLKGKHGTLDPATRDPEQQYYDYVGHCYVHGMMDDGESYFEDGDYETVMLR